MCIIKFKKSTSGIAIFNKQTIIILTIIITNLYKLLHNFPYSTVTVNLVKVI